MTSEVTATTDFQEQGASSGMVALRPVDADALAVDGGDPPESLHVTLVFLGDAENVDPEEASAAAEAAALAVGGPIVATVAGVGALGSEDPPATVLLLNGEALDTARDAALAALTDAPEQHEPFIPHLTLGYGVDVDSGDWQGREIVLDAVSADVAGEQVAKVALVARAVTAAPGDGTRVEGVVVVEGEMTGDGREIEPGALSWDVLPIPIIWDRDEGDHSAMTVGFIDAVERDGANIRASGYLSDSDDEETQASVQRVEELLEEGAVGVSVSLDDVSYEVRVSPELWERWQELDDPEAELEPPADDAGRKIIVAEDAGDWVEVTTSARIRHVAIVDTAAFADAKLAVVASMLPELPAAHMARHDDPQGTPLTIEDDGRFHGYVAPSGVCHRGMPGCVTLESLEADGPVDWEAFATSGPVPLDDGTRIRVGCLTMRGGHPDKHLTAAEARAHHDDTATVVADLVTWRTPAGVAAAGSLRPGLDVAALREALGSAPSIEVWHTERGRELLGVQLVPTPAWPVAASVDGGGMVLEQATPVRGAEGLTACGCSDERPPDVASLERRIKVLEIVAGETLVASVEGRT